MSTSTAARPPLEQAALQEAAGPNWSVRLLPEAESTNAEASRAPERNLVVIADHQTAGRGRLDRTWQTPAGAALTFSAVFDPVVEAEWWPVIPLAAGVAVARAIGAPARLKWPNDVLLGEEKVCGILVERVGTRPPYAVIGIGINVDQARGELPVETATSLALAGLPRDRTDLFGAVLRELRRALVVLASDPHTMVGEYRGLSATLDRRVRVDLPGGEALVGTALDIDAHGALVVGHDVPRERGWSSLAPTTTVGAGDVVHVRPGSDADVT